MLKEKYAYTEDVESVIVRSVCVIKPIFPQGFRLLLRHCNEYRHKFRILGAVAAAFLVVSQFFEQGNVTVPSAEAVVVFCSCPHPNNRETDRRFLVNGISLENCIAGHVNNFRTKPNGEVARKKAPRTRRVSKCSRPYCKRESDSHCAKSSLRLSFSRDRSFLMMFSHDCSRHAILPSGPA